MSTLSTATVIVVRYGIPHVQYVGMPTPPPTQINMNGQRAYALEAFKQLYPDADARCDYHVNGAWEIISNTLPVNVLGVVLLESAERASMVEMELK